jgi:hypothetical protein
LAHQIREVVLPEGKAGANAHILKYVSDHEADGKEDEDASPSVEHCAVNQGEDNGRKYVQHDDYDYGNFAWEDLQDPRAGVEHEERP